MSTQTTLRIMPREMRMMAERILSLTNLPKGVFMTLSDHVMFSQGLGLGGYAMLEESFDELETADPKAISISEENASAMTLSGGGQHAWIVASAIVDFLGELVAAHGRATLTCTDVSHPAELAIVVPLGRRAGLDVVVDDAGKLSARRLELTGSLSADEPLLWSLLNNGYPIRSDLWWRIYDMAKKALAADTVVSRRHAGPMIVNDDGTIIGRKDNDDETDISFLASDGKGKALAGGSPQ